MEKFNVIAKILSAAAVSMLIIFFAGCSENNSKDKQTVKEDLVPVQTAKVERKSLSQSKTLNGTLEGEEQSIIVAKISERITSINVRVNDYVKKGDVLIQLDKTGPSSNYLQTSAAFENTKKDFERMKALFEAGAVAEQQLDQAKTAYEVAKANFNASESTVNLTSPISGIITELNVNVGDWVTPGTHLAVVANTNSMIIKFSVSETEMQKLKIGDQVKIYSESAIDREVTGRITEISRSASLDSRSFQVKAKFQNSKNSFFKPGMFVNVDVVLELQENILVVPTSALTISNNETVVYVINNNTAHPVNVETGINNEKYTEIISGLKEGQAIVTLGMNNLEDSTKVTIVN